MDARDVPDLELSDPKRSGEISIPNLAKYLRRVLT
jgi:hypothetical protein